MTRLKSGKVEKLKGSKTFQPSSHSTVQPSSPSTFRLEKAVRAQGGAVVKPHQVRAMVIAAHRAYKVQSKLGLVDDGTGFDAWRKAALHDVVGAAAPSSFRAVTQRDYAAAIAYFEELAGGEPLKSGKVEKLKSSEAEKLKSAFQPFNLSTFQPFNPSAHQLRGADEERRALWALDLAEREVAGSFGGREGARRYADALFERIHRTSRIAASAKQTWAVIFTLRNRAKSRRAAIGAETALESRGAAGGVIGRADGSGRFPAFSPAFSRA